MIESGRVNNIELRNRVCPLCNSGEIEDEYHFVLICPFYVDLRVTLPTHYTVNPNRNKFNSLMRSNYPRVIKSIAFYVYNAFSQRDRFLNG